MDVNGFLSGFGQDLGPDPQKIRSTAQDYFRRCATRTNLVPKELSCRAAICVDLACSQHHLKFERALAIKKCGVQPKDYTQTMAALMDVLKLGANITIKALCVKTQDASHHQKQIEAFLSKCRSCYGLAAGQEGVLVAAAFHLYCQAAGVRTSVQTLCASLKELGPISSELQRIEESRSTQKKRGRPKKIQQPESEDDDNQPLKMKYLPSQPITVDSDEGSLDKRKAEDEGKTPEKRSKSAHPKRDKRPMNENAEKENNETSASREGAQRNGMSRIGKRGEGGEGEGEGAVSSGRVFVGQGEGGRGGQTEAEPYEVWKQRILASARERLALS